MSEEGLRPAQRCPRCDAPIEGVARNCRHCGHATLVNDLPLEAVEPTASTELALLPLKPPDASMSPHPDAIDGSERHAWPTPLVGAAGALVVIMTMLVLGWLYSQTSPQPVEAARVVPPSSASPAIVESAPAQPWVGRRQAIWAGDGSTTISFELQSSNDVPVWMTRVRPVLSVRCVSRSTEIFVAIRSAASIEPQAGSHTVRIQIDDDQEMVQQWSDSESGQELFAPNGLAIVRRLAHARRMRFGFTPYNAQPVMAEFAVQGFDQLAGLVAGACGWRLDDSRTPATRSARLK